MCCFANTLLNERKQLGGYSIHHLCKSIIVENTEWDAKFVADGQECSDPTYSRFYCIIVQYTTKYAQLVTLHQCLIFATVTANFSVFRMMSHKVYKFMRSLRSNVSKKYYHVNQAKSSVRYEHVFCSNSLQS